MLDTFVRVKKTKERKMFHCGDCKTRTIHNLEARCEGVWREPYNQASGGQLYSIYRCGACDEVCYETLSWDERDIEYDEDDEPYVARRSTQYPAPVSAHFNFNTKSTPYRLNTVLDEMLYALAGSKVMLATIGLRLAVEFIVNDKGCKGKTLVQKINDLHEQDHIDADQKDLLHKIRIRGNRGAHEATGMTVGEIVAGMAIIEGLLEKLYNGPARHEDTIRRAKQLFKDDVSIPII